jgi:hypothetical protein
MAWIWRGSDTTRDEDEKEQDPAMRYEFGGHLERDDGGEEGTVG